MLPKNNFIQEKSMKTLNPIRISDNPILQRIVQDLKYSMAKIDIKTGTNNNIKFNRKQPNNTRLREKTQYMGNKQNLAPKKHAIADKKNNQNVSRMTVLSKQGSLQKNTLSPKRSQKENNIRFGTAHIILQSKNPNSKHLLQNTTSNDNSKNKPNGINSKVLTVKNNNSKNIVKTSSKGNLNKNASKNNILMSAKTNQIKLISKTNEVKSPTKITKTNEIKTDIKSNEFKMSSRSSEFRTTLKTNEMKTSSRFSEVKTSPKNNEVRKVPSKTVQKNSPKCIANKPSGKSISAKSSPRNSFSQKISSKCNQPVCNNFKDMKNILLELRGKMNKMESCIYDIQSILKKTKCSDDILSDLSNVLCTTIKNIGNQDNKSVSKVESKLVNNILLEHRKSLENHTLMLKISNDTTNSSLTGANKTNKEVNKKHSAGSKKNTQIVNKTTEINSKIIQFNNKYNKVLNKIADNNSIGDDMSSMCETDADKETNQKTLMPHSQVMKQVFKNHSKQIEKIATKHPDIFAEIMADVSTAPPEIIEKTLTNHLKIIEESNKVPKNIHQILTYPNVIRSKPTTSLEKIILNPEHVTGILPALNNNKINCNDGVLADSKNNNGQVNLIYNTESSLDMRSSEGRDGNKLKSGISTVNLLGETAKKINMMDGKSKTSPEDENKLDTESSKLNYVEKFNGTSKSELITDTQKSVDDYKNAQNQLLTIYRSNHGIDDLIKTTNEDNKDISKILENIEKITISLENINKRPLITELKDSSDTKNRNNNNIEIVPTSLLNDALLDPPTGVHTNNCVDVNNLKSSFDNKLSDDLPNINQDLENVTSIGQLSESIRNINQVFVNLSNIRLSEDFSNADVSKNLPVDSKIHNSDPSEKHVENAIRLPEISSELLLKKNQTLSENVRGNEKCTRILCSYLPGNSLHDENDTNINNMDTNKNSIYSVDGKCLKCNSASNMNCFENNHPLMFINDHRVNKTLAIKDSRSCNRILSHCSVESDDEEMNSVPSDVLRTYESMVQESLDKIEKTLINVMGKNFTMPKSMSSGEMICSIGDTSSTDVVRKNHHRRFILNDNNSEV